MTQVKAPRALRVFLAAVVVVGAASTLSACNTVSGAGKDVSSVGHDVTRGADYTQSKWKQTTPQAATQ